VTALIRECVLFAIRHFQVNWAFANNAGSRFHTLLFRPRCDVSPNSDCVMKVVFFSRWRSLIGSCTCVPVGASVAAWSGYWNESGHGLQSFTQWKMLHVLHRRRATVFGDSAIIRDSQDSIEFNRDMDQCTLYNTTMTAVSSRPTPAHGTRHGTAVNINNGVNSVWVLYIERVGVDRSISTQQLLSHRASQCAVCTSSDGRSVVHRPL